MFAVRPITTSFQRAIMNGRPASARFMATIVDGVDFDTVAREWRCKWSSDDDKKSLAEAQKALNEILSEVKGVDGFKKIDRVVCGGCLDFKVITKFLEEARIN
ncbi:unnamed protein product [Cylindrotheca closterium]|uniref:Uncharacterized protein n=1 Tax=Cylindrotheca closterium TaxID=2856 RepID=A0AAD2G049_9STRA|nr:unnamed protein product [Cylindrotheca closterium]